MASWIKCSTLLACSLALALLATPVPAEVVVVVAAENPTRTLNRAELADLYLGRRNQLPNGDPVTLIDQRPNSVSHRTFYRQFLDRTPAQLKAHWSRLVFTGRGRPPRRVADDAAMVEAIAGNPTGLGYLDAGYVDARLRIVEIE